MNVRKTMGKGVVTSGIHILIRATVLIFAFLFGLDDRAAGVESIKKFFVTPPPFTEGIFPCSQCHQGMPVNRKQRKLDQMHQEITLKHMPEGWCFDCHNADNRDTLRLANGKIVSFEESYSLCGQCHGTVFRDWKTGLHGKRTGSWNGDKQYLLCVHCHWPHEPKFRSVQPLPPPVSPYEIKR